MNHDKLQCIALGQDATIKVKLSVAGRTILPSNVVKVLGVTKDKDKYVFKHVFDICFKAAR